MRTNIFLNAELVAEALKYTNVTTKRELVDIALREFIENHRRHDIRDLRGKIQLAKNYDYKKLRKNRHGKTTKGKI